jgi:hypothetical protein
MSDLETENKSPIHAMINDDPCSLSKSDQDRLARWAVLKAMVIEATHRKREHFYNAHDRLQIKSASAIPVGTLVWLGRLSAKGFHAGGTYIWGDIDNAVKAFHGCVTTTVMGHLVIQVISGRVSGHAPNVKVRINCKPGEWNTNLLDVWPARESLSWPPAVSFTVRGPDSVAFLIDRWKIGRNIL